FNPDIIYIHTGIHNITNLPAAGSDEQTVRGLFLAEWNKFEEVISAAVAYGCPVIANNFEYPAVRVLGNRENYDVSGKVRFISELNLKLADFARLNEKLFINDINYLSALYGLEKWSDPTYYNSYKYGLNPDAIPLLCHSVSSIIKSIFGRNKKVLLLDLDNTLWGGVIGDDGVDGIELGIENPSGIAFSDLQRYAKELKGIGVLLGVVSKNEEGTAKSGFDHPSSILTVEDFSVFIANWEEKASNIKKATEILNLGSDSFVFADDNPAERELVEHSGLGVSVAKYTIPERFAENISRSGYFEATSMSEEDLIRADMYTQNAMRESEKSRFTDYGEYLSSLKMKAGMGSFTDRKQKRITQLINKTNQFNPTTRRYTEEEISEIEVDENYIKISARLEDKFGDNGIVCALIAKCWDKTAIIELFVMSCRVFKRDLEKAVFDRLVEIAASKGIESFEASYIKTSKNGFVETLYPDFGFVLINESGEEKIYRYEIEKDYVKKNKHIEVMDE
ncbi:MAG: HAD-IIIC family phosphatase, partial [Ruminococcaceae bacterium]|nr:HAD-IIIC family phosphatase [Oscillospiraceae bacterium]